MPLQSFDFNRDYVPRVGDLVRVHEDFVPIGRAEVISVRQTGAVENWTVTLRGRGRSGARNREFDDTIAYWRHYGIRQDNQPIVGDLITWGTRSVNFWVDGMEEDAVRTRYHLRREGNESGSSTNTFYSTDMRDVAVLRHGEEQAVPATGDSFYYPVVGDRVRVDRPYSPQGLCVVSTVRGAGSSARVTLRPADISGGRSETEYLSDWRNFGIRLIERYEPARGDFVALDPGFSPEGPQYVSHVDDEGVTLIPLGHGNSRASGVTHGARSWQSWGIHFLSNIIHEAERRAADRSVDTWRETPADTAGGETTQQEDNMPVAGALAIPGGTRYSIDLSRAEQLAYQYDPAVYGDGASGYTLVHQALQDARENPDDGALLHLKDGLTIWFKSRRIGYNFTVILIDGQGVYENSEHPGGVGYDREGYDPDGYDCDGFDPDGYDCDGYNGDGYNEDGYDRDGFDSEGYDLDGYDSSGVDRYGDSRYDDDMDGRLHSWDYKPTPVFHKTADDPQPKTFYGVEIELTSDCTSSEMELIKRVGDNENLLYPKSDGSVSGYELNVHPMTWAWATASFPWKMVEDLDNLGSTVDTQENGIHVHVSRDGFSGEVHLFRWMKFVYRNQAHAERIAGRKTDHWAGFREGHMSSQKQHALNQMRMRKQREREEAGDYFEPRSEYQSDNTTASRYSAINTTNAATVEVRIFASTTNPSVFRQRVGFVAATVEYTRQLNAQAIINGGWDWSAFRTWLLANAETYPDLAAEEEKLLTAEQIRAKSELDAVERRVLRRKWVTSSELMSFAEFIEREQGRQDLVDEDQAAESVRTGFSTLEELRDSLLD